MKELRASKFDHKVRILSPTSKGEYIVQWDGYEGRHDYLMAESLEDLDILITELSQAIYNYKRKKLIYKNVQ